jgi:NAD(P)-dependent dehydrogenase (short-subunit alcohol dehydrogenase family)
MTRAVIVTGAGGGVGAAAVHELARRGARVLAVDIDSRVDEVAKDADGEVVAYHADVTDAAAVEELVRLAVNRFGELNAIFNNAGILGPLAPVTDYPDELFERVMAVNVRGVYLGMKYAIPALRAAGGGAIVNTASTGALIAVGGLSAYIASKHAVLGMTRSVALELAKEPITVNALCPGPMDTPMVADRVEELRREDPSMESISPSGRLGRPEEIASVAAWLLLDAPKYLTGVPVTVDGALTAR